MTDTTNFTTSKHSLHRPIFSALWEHFGGGFLCSQQSEHRPGFFTRFYGSKKTMNDNKKIFQRKYRDDPLCLEDQNSPLLTVGSPQQPCVFHAWQR